MPKRRISYVEYQRVLDDSGVLTIPITIRDLLTSLYIELRATNGATRNTSNSVPENISAIELIDGARVLMSLSGPQIFAKSAYDLGWLPHMLFEELPGNTQSMGVELMFGRWLGDNLLALDPSRFDNLQLRISWNLATVTAVGATGFVSGSGRLTVIGNIMEGTPNPIGYIKAAQVNQFTTAASGKTYVDLSRQSVIKRLMIRSAADYANGIPGISHVKMSCDNDKFVPLDIARVDLRNLCTTRNKPFHYRQTLHVTNGRTFKSILKWEEVVHLIPDSADTVYTYNNTGMGSGTVGQITAGSADANYRTAYAFVEGWLPYNVLALDMGEWDDPDSWFDPQPFGAIRLELTNDYAGAAASVVTETVELYS